MENRSKPGLGIQAEEEGHGRTVNYARVGARSGCARDGVTLPDAAGRCRSAPRFRAPRAAAAPGHRAMLRGGAGVFAR